MVVAPDVGETPVMTSDRAWAFSHSLFLASAPPHAREDGRDPAAKMEATMARCRAHVWAVHRGCEYDHPADQPADHPADHPPVIRAPR